MFREQCGDLRGWSGMNDRGMMGLIVDHRE